MNARQEFINHTRERVIKCVVLHFYDVWQYVDEEDEKTTVPLISLKVGWTNADMEVFLNAIDNEYDNGYGGQQLFGTIWYDDGTWSDRGEYDGSEWWDYHHCPQIPPECEER